MKKEPTGIPDPSPHQGPIVQPIIDDLVSKQKTPDPAQKQAPPQAAELDQDPGGGFNPDHTDIQT